MLRFSVFIFNTLVSLFFYVLIVPVVLTKPQKKLPEAVFLPASQTLWYQKKKNLKTNHVFAAWRQVVGEIADKNRNLSTLLSEMGFSASQRRVLGQLKISRRNFLGKELQGIFIVPEVCHWQGELLVWLIAVDGRSGKLRGLFNNLLPKKIDKKTTVMAFKKLIKKLRGKAVSWGDSEFGSAFKLYIRSQQENTAGKVGNSTCGNLLVQKKLVEKGYQVLFKGTESIGRMLADKMPDIFAKAKATRVVSLKWRGVEPLVVKAQWTESVFGRNFLQGTHNWEASLENGQVALSFDADFNKQLRLQDLSLRLDDLPRLVHLEGRLAYLDKGRAWGLQLRDRLVAQDNDKIFGYVMGFFGPKKDLRTNHGGLLPEGAIVYISRGFDEMQEVSYTFDFE